DDLITSPIPFTTPYKVKDPIVLLEKCDKIWETLKVIKNVENNKSTNTLNSLSPKKKDTESYIKYQPVLGNNNSALPNFKLSVKSTQKLFSCATCGKLYLEKRSLRHHSAKVHGIYIPLDRPRKTIKHQNDSNNERDSNVVNTEQSNQNKLNLKRSPIKQHIDTLLQSVTSHVTESDTESVSNIRSQSRKKSVSIHTSNTFNGSKSVRKEGKNEFIYKDLHKNGTPIVLTRDSSSQQQCILCKQFVEDVKTHVIDYHKIECSNSMLKEFEKTSAVPKVKEIKKMTMSKESLRNDVLNTDKQSPYFQRNKKRKLNISQAGNEKRYKVNSNTYQVKSSLQNYKQQCDICFGLYTPNNVKKHMNSHRIRGETKENFHLINCNYLNSPLFEKQNINENSNNVSLKNTKGYRNINKDNSTNLFTNGEIEEQVFQNQCKSSRDHCIRNNGKRNSICSCGRTFRNPHTLYLHKGKCRLQNSETAQESDTVLSAKGNNSDRDSGLGINITIKKKNDSYEIVGRDADNEKILQNSTCLRNTEFLSNFSEDSTEADPQDWQYEMESSKYSGNHSFLKIQCIDEDIDIDIEENSQSGSDLSSMNNNLIANEVTNDSNVEQQKQETKTQENMSGRIMSDVNNSCKKVFRTEKHEKCNNVKSNIVNKSNICVCGTLFDTRKALNFHITKQHPCSQLMCGYCKKSVTDIDTWKKHQCTVSKAKTFVDILLEIACPYCNTLSNSYVTFDNHISLKHSDSLVPFQCYQCDKRFCNTTARRIHIKDEHFLPICAICEMKCPDNVKARHEGYHYGLGFPCHICKKTYSTKTSLSKHLVQLHPKRLIDVICDH
ncbi:hypothetical protein WN55_08966, partial [Dufourea novaeangliae]